MAVICFKDMREDDIAFIATLLNEDLDDTPVGWLKLNGLESDETASIPRKITKSLKDCIKAAATI